jgi:hypothetical protein
MKNVNRCVLILNEAYGKIMTNFNFISMSMSKFSEALCNKDQSQQTVNFLKEPFNSISKQIHETRDIFQKFYSNFSTMLNKESDQFEYIPGGDHQNKSNSLNITTEEMTTNANSHLNHANQQNKKIKNSYEKLFNEFSRIEKVTKELTLSQKKSEQLRKNRIKMLEMKLQGYCDDIKNLNIDNLSREFIFQPQKNVVENTHMIIENNPGIINYAHQLNIDEFIEEGSNFPSVSIRTLESHQEQHNTSNTNNKANNNLIQNNVYHNYSKFTQQQNPHPEVKNALVNQILNLNVTKGDEMINFIESLLMKTESVYNNNILNKEGNKNNTIENGNQESLNNTIQNLKENKK